ncbi:MAG: MFS transporter [Bacteroidota bacterium]
MFRKALQLYRNSFAGLSQSIWLLSLITLVNRSGTMVIPFLTLYLTTTRGFSLIEAGWVMACFGLGSILGTLVGGRLTDRVGHYPVMFWSLLASGLMFFVLQQMHELWSICLTIFVLTTISDAFRPAIMVSIASYSKPENRTRSLSLIRLAINLGFAIGPAIGGMIAVGAGYDWLFWIDGMTCISAALLFRMALVEKADAEAEMEPTNPASEARTEGSVPSAYRDRPYLFFFLMIFLSGFAFIPFFSAVPLYFRQDLLLNEAQIGWLMAMNGLLIALVEMPLVFVLEGRYRHLKIVAVGTLLIGLAYLLFNVVGLALLGAVLGVLAITIGEVLNMPFANTFALNRSQPGNRGAYMAIYGNAYSVGHVLAPMLSLQIAEHFGFNVLWYLLALVCMLSAVGTVLLERSLARQRSHRALDRELDYV